MITYGVFELRLRVLLLEAAPESSTDEGSTSDYVMRAVSSGGERLVDTEEVAGSSPASPTISSFKEPGNTGLLSYMA